jgi:hypothetical protein
MVRQHAKELWQLQHARRTAGAGGAAQGVAPRHNNRAPGKGKPSGAAGAPQRQLQAGPAGAQQRQPQAGAALRPAKKAGAS